MVQLNLKAFDTVNHNILLAKLKAPGWEVPLLNGLYVLLAREGTCG